MDSRLDCMTLSGDRRLRQLSRCNGLLGCRGVRPLELRHVGAEHGAPPTGTTGEKTPLCTAPTGGPPTAPATTIWPAISPMGNITVWMLK